MTTKNNKKSKKSQNKIITIVKIGVVLAIVSVLLIGIAVTTKQYIAYKSLDKKVEEVAKLLEQSGIENITKKDECEAIKLGTPIHCSINLESNKKYSSQSDAEIGLSTSIEIIENSKISTFKQGDLFNSSKSSTDTDIYKTVSVSNDECTVASTLFGKENNDPTLKSFVVCGYDAWWKQIL